MQCIDLGPGVAHWAHTRELRNETGYFSDFSDFVFPVVFRTICIFQARNAEISKVFQLLATTCHSVSRTEGSGHGHVGHFDQNCPRLVFGLEESPFFEVIVDTCKLMYVDFSTVNSICFSLGQSLAAAPLWNHCAFIRLFLVQCLRPYRSNMI